MDVKAEETAVIPAQPGDAKQELAKLGFPEVQGDTAPSALIPKACACLQKNAAKINGVLSAFGEAETLTDLQTRNPVSIKYQVFFLEIPTWSFNVSESDHASLSSSKTAT